MRSHAERELEVFRDFAADAKLSIDLASIEKMEPPYPDIRRRSKEGTKLHFEISEILDPDYASLLTRFHDGRLGSQRYYEALPEPERAAFDERFADGSIFLNYANDSTSRQREKSLPAVFKFLLTLSSKRPKSVSFDENLPSPYLERIAIYRDHKRSKPLFESAFGTSTNASPVTVVQKKVKKTYKADGPVSLLAFWYQQPMLPDDVWLSDVERYTEQCMEGSIFADCWVYDWGRREIKLRRLQPPNSKLGQARDA